MPATFSRAGLKTLSTAGGVKLRGTSAYGVRLYRNGSSLAMHTDKVRVVGVLVNDISYSCVAVQLQTHVISSIVHIAHQYDNESQPWPIEIENHRTGELVSVVLEPGQVSLLARRPLLPFTP